MSKITVQRQCWQWWPRVLIAEKHNDDGTREERRYVPEGGTENEWKARCRDVLELERKARSDYEQAMVTLQGEFARAEHMKAERDGLQWAVEERDALIRDLLERRCRRSCADCEHDEDDGCGIYRRMRELGIEVG